MKSLILPNYYCKLWCACLCSGLYFHIGETERKCFIEEIPDETMVTGNYKVYYTLNSIICVRLSLVVFNTFSRFNCMIQEPMDLHHPGDLKISQLLMVEVENIPPSRKFTISRFLHESSLHRLSTSALRLECTWRLETLMTKSSFPRYFTEIRFLRFWGNHS